MKDRHSYAHKGYEFLVQRIPLKGLSWVAFGYPKDRAP